MIGESGKIRSSSSPRGIPIPAFAGAFGGLAPMVAHVGLRWLLRSLVLTTSTMALKSKTGRITALQAMKVYVSLATH